jgi:hypothetical protein
MADQQYPTPWRIARNAKMQFCVERDVAPRRKEFVLSASGRPSSFKTWAGAKRALRGANSREA